MALAGFWTGKPDRGEFEKGQEVIDGWLAPDRLYTQPIYSVIVEIYIFGCKLIQKKIEDFVELSTVLS